LETIINNTPTLVYPSKKNEEYKYCDIEKIYNNSFTEQPEAIVNIDDAKSIVAKIAQTFSQKTIILAFVNGKFSKQLSTIFDVEGLTIYNEKLDCDNIVFQNYFDKCIDPNEVLVKNNAQKIGEVLFINVSKKVEVKTPIASIYITLGDDKFEYATRTLVVAEKYSRLNFTEIFYGENDGAKFHNNVSEIVLEKNANVNHVKIQHATNNDVLLNTTFAMQHTYSKYKSFVFSTNAQLIRNNTTATLDGEFIETFLYGLYIANNKQLIDNHTLVDHQKPNCYSNELYKGVISDKATAVFNGKIFVRQDAQKTNAYQSNRNILLSDNATINTKPQLQIFADDVKCSHGTSTGKIDDEALFYLRSRGISADTAKKMMLQAFVAEVSDVLPEWSSKGFALQLIEGKLV